MRVSMAKTDNDAKHTLRAVLKSEEDISPQKDVFRQIEASDMPQSHYHSDRHAGDLLDRLNAYRLAGEMCDVILMAKDSMIIAHGCILRTASPYFYTLLQPSRNMVTKHSLDMMHFEGSALQIMVEFFYTSTLRLNLKNAWQLLSVAGILGIDEVANACISLIKSSVSTKNCLQLRRDARANNSEYLLAFCEDYIREHFKELLSSDALSDLDFAGYLRLVSDIPPDVWTTEQKQQTAEKWAKDNSRQDGRILEVAEEIFGKSKHGFICTHCSKVFGSEHELYTHYMHAFASTQTQKEATNHPQCVDGDNENSVYSLKNMHLLSPKWFENAPPIEWVSHENSVYSHETSRDMGSIACLEYPDSSMEKVRDDTKGANVATNDVVSIASIVDSSFRPKVDSSSGNQVNTVSSNIDDHTSDGARERIILPKDVNEGQHQSDIAYKCKRCGKITTSFKELKKHVQTHKHRCPHCRENRKSEQDLKFHITDSHSEICFYCGKIILKTDLKKHTIKHHTKRRHVDKSKERAKKAESRDDCRSSPSKSRTPQGKSSTGSKTAQPVEDECSKSEKHRHYRHKGKKKKDDGHVNTTPSKHVEDARMERSKSKRVSRGARSGDEDISVEFSHSQYGRTKTTVSSTVKKRSHDEKEIDDSHNSRDKDSHHKDSREAKSEKVDLYKCPACFEPFDSQISYFSHVTHAHK